MAESEWVSPPNSARLSTRTSGTVADQPGIDIKGRGVVENNQRDDSTKVEILHNVSVETGRELQARVKSDEPSFEPAIDYVVVLRFEGVREVKVADSDDVDDEASGIIVDYFEPETSRFARLGR